MKTCRFQGHRQSDGCITCKLDGSRRRADRCNRYDCKRWNNTPWKAFLWWWDYGTICYSWNEKPHDVQERDLEQYNRDAEKVRALIQQLEAERDAMKEALGLMVYQYCVRGDKLDHLYMCAGETAFRVLGLEQYSDTRTLESWLFPECQDKEE